MKIDWRVSAIAAGSAFLLSVLVGVIGNVSFGVLILRGIVAAVIFGAGAIAASLLIDRYLPELKESSSSASASSEHGGVDIVVEGDEDLQRAAFDDGANGDAEEDLAELSPAQDGGTGPEDDEFSAEGTEYTVETADGSDEVIEEVEEVEDAGEDLTGAGEAQDVEEMTGDGKLPDVDAMSDSFTEMPLGEESVEESTDNGEDPEIMARAIRTVLKREE